MTKRTHQEKLQQAWNRKVSLETILFPRVRNPEKGRRRAAYHEAGHAVLCVVGAYDIEHVTITEGSGLCKDIGRPDWHRAEYTWMLLAGVVAEARFLRCGIFSMNPYTWSNDWESAREMIAGRIGMEDQESWNDPEMDAGVDDAFANAKRLVAEHWPLIERVAGALLERGRLDGDEVLHLCGRLSLLKPSDILA